MRVLVLFLMVCAAGIAACSSSDVRDDQAAAQPERIVLFGASGRSGRYLMAELKRQNRNFVAVTSNLERAKLNVDIEAEWVQADVRSPESVAAALAGASHAISALGATEFKGPNGPEFVDYEGVRNVVDASLAANVRQMILISASGVTRPDHPLNKLGNVMVWKLKGEDYLRASGLPYTIVRPGGLLDNEPGLNKLVLRQGDDLPYTSKLSVTGRGDLALICIAALDEPAALNTTFEVFDDRNEPAGERDWSALFGALQPDVRD